MAIIVNTNMSAIKTQTNLNKATSSLNKALERMSTGLKINSAKDDAAGMFVATNLAKQISGSKIAQSNVATGANVLSTVEGDMDVILDNLNRIRDLTVQASNGVYDADSQKAMSDEVAARMEEIDRVALASNFNGLKLLNGDLKDKGMRLQVGANANADANMIKVDGSVFESKKSADLGLKTAADTAAAFNNPTKAAEYLDTIDSAIGKVTTAKSTIGAVQNRLDAASDSLITTIENASAAKSTIMDADVAEESAEFTKQQILRQTSATLLVQANALPSLAISLISA